MFIEQAMFATEMLKADVPNKQYLKHLNICGVLLTQQMNSQEANLWQSTATGTHVCETLSVLIISMQI